MTGLTREGWVILCQGMPPIPMPTLTLTPIPTLHWINIGWSVPDVTLVHSTEMSYLEFVGVFMVATPFKLEGCDGRLIVAERVREVTGLLNPVESRSSANARPPSWLEVELTLETSLS